MLEQVNNYVLDNINDSNKIDDHIVEFDNAVCTINLINSNKVKDKDLNTATPTLSRLR